MDTVVSLGLFGTKKSRKLDLPVEATQPRTVALTTRPSSRSVLRIVRMSRRTMRLHTHVLSTTTASHILQTGDRFEVIRVHTMSNTTKVIELKRFRDWTDEQFIRDTMSNTLCRRSGSEVSVSGNKPRGPHPTRTQAFSGLRVEAFGTIEVNLRAKAFGQQHAIVGHHRSSRSVVKPGTLTRRRVIQSSTRIVWDDE
jgi:hypothetical protein